MLSGVVVCFARAVYDTPKIAALLLATGAAVASWKLGLVAAAIALGGLLPMGAGLGAMTCFFAHAGRILKWAPSPSH